MLRTAAAVSVGLALVVAVEATNAPHAEAAPPPPAAGETQPAEGIARAVLDATNRFRTESGLEPLKREPRLDRAAETLAEAMVNKRLLSHEADGRTHADRAEAEGYRYGVLLENIEFIQRPDATYPARVAEWFLEGWRNSPGHLANLRSVEVSDIGVAVRGDPTTGFYAVQVFGKQLG
jgi:uncharacterized protein YkwD